MTTFTKPEAAFKVTYMFDGVMTAISHLATCGPSLKAKASKSDPTPIPVLSNDDGKFMYMPGAGFRSKLRGAATMLALAAARKRDGMAIKLVDAQYLRLGGIKQNGPEAIFNSVAHEKLITSNPVISLFGSSTPWVTGKLMVSHQTCLKPMSDVKPMQVDGVRSSMLRRNPEILEFLDTTSVADIENQVSTIRASVAQKKQIKEFERLIKALPRDDKESAAEYRSKIAELKDEDKIVVSEQMPLEGYLAIPPGAQLSTMMRLLNASDIEFGCLLASLEGFAHMPMLGAHMAHGAGEVSATWKVRAGGSNEEIGEIEIVPFVGLKISGQKLLDARAAFTAFMDNSPLFDPQAPPMLASKKISEEAVNV